MFGTFPGCLINTLFINELVQNSLNFVNFLVQAMLTNDVVISVGGCNYYGTEACLIVFKAIRNLAGKDKSGCGPSLSYKRVSLQQLSATDDHQLFRESGTYEHALQETKHYSCTWKKRKRGYSISSVLW